LSVILDYPSPLYTQKPNLLYKHLYAKNAIYRRWWKIKRKRL